MLGVGRRHISLKSIRLQSSNRLSIAHGFIEVLYASQFELLLGLRLGPWAVQVPDHPTGLLLRETAFEPSLFWDKGQAQVGL